MSSLVLHQHRFPSMGTEIEMLLLGRGAADSRGAFARAEALAAAWNQTFSRFLPDSELGRLNAASGSPVPVSAWLFESVELAVLASHASGGLFNPLILPALVAHGYDRSFDRLGGERIVPAARPATPDAGAIRLDAGRRTVELPRGAALDLGGIAKGLYADTLALQLTDWPGGIVCAGGDMRAWGQGPDDGAWLVGVEDPEVRDGDVAIISLRAGGIATSGANRRRWRQGTGMAHHLIDPRTGNPAASSYSTVTVLAPSASLAEIGSTALFIDPAAARQPPLTGSLWAAIEICPRQFPILTTFNPEAPFDVHFNRPA